MDRSPALFLTIGVALLTVLAPLGGIVGAAAPQATSLEEPATRALDQADGAAPQTSTTVVVTQGFDRIVSQPGRVEASRRFEIPDNVRSLRTTLPAGAENVRPSSDFERIGDRRYEWSGGSQTPSITYTLPVNETGSVSGPEGADGQYRFADVGEWALFRRPQNDVDVTFTGEISFDQRTVADGPGAAGQQIVFLGEHQVASKSAHGQTVRLVVPAAADLEEPRSVIFDSIADAADTLRVGDRDESVFFVAAPTSVPWAVEGLQTGDADAYVTADERLDDPHNTWLHEYVHTRQGFTTSEETTWVTEASATYYAALLTLDQDRIGYSEFRSTLETGTNRRFADVVLADPGTWTSGANYRKGALVAGELDRQLRLASDAAADFQTVFSRFNTRTTPVSGAEFLDIVRDAGGDGPASDARRYTTTTDAPSTWSAAEHERAFGTLPARIETSLADDGLAVRGRFRNESVGPGDLTLVTGERLTAAVRITNTGGTAGEYTVRATVDGTTVDSATGPIEPETERTETLTVPFEETGTVTLGVADSARTVTVADPADLAVTRLVANRSTLGPGEAVELAVSLQNAAARPGERELQVTQDGSQVATKTVRLPGGANGTERVTVVLEDPGDYTLAVADRSVVVSVRSAQPTAGTPGEDGPGFGPVAAVLALATITAALLARRRP